MTLNTPRAMLERLAFGCFLALLVVSIGLTGLGAIFGLHSGDARPAILGVAGLLLVLAVRRLGYKHLHFGEWGDSLEPVDGGNAFELDPVLGERAHAFAEMLAALEALQQRIAVGEGDVWAVQRLRHDASVMLAAEPALREVFAAELAGHPELA
jgi:hypothetical protein